MDVKLEEGRQLPKKSMESGLMGTPHPTFNLRF